MSRAILIALQKRKTNSIFITNRSFQKAHLLSKLFNCELIDWEERHTFKSSVIINCTPVGMKPEPHLSPLNYTSLNNFDKIMDVVVNDEDTRLIKDAKKLNILNVSGLYMTFFQAAEQFKIYTGYQAPIDYMLMAYNKKFKNSFKL